MRLELYVGTYVINFLAPFQSISLFARGSGASRPFIVNTAKFIKLPQSNMAYIIERDGPEGDWYAHDQTFTNVIEDERVSFDPSPTGALVDFIHRFEGSDRLTREDKE